MVELEETGNHGHLFGGSLLRADRLFVEASQVRGSGPGPRWRGSFAGLGELEGKEAGRGVLKCSCSRPSISPSALALLPKLSSPNRSRNGAQRK